jgi:hypothetical protein
VRTTHIQESAAFLHPYQRLEIFGKAWVDLLNCCQKLHSTLATVRPQVASGGMVENRSAFGKQLDVTVDEPRCIGAAISIKTRS